MENNDISCENPRIIQNPMLRDLLAQYKSYWYKGKRFSFNLRGVAFDKYVRMFGTKKLGITLDNMNDYYILSDDGEVIPIFMKVPCGHCDCCLSVKTWDYVHRCKLESLSHKFKPYFVTLTYNNEHLPPDGVSVRDCQLFLKRLRINLSRKLYPDNIRYLLVSEYGKNGRAHYHAIIWGLHPTGLYDYKNINKIIEDSWQNGFITMRIVDVANDKCFRYTHKYLFKDSKVPDGMNPTFRLSSRRHGGIGALFLDSIADDVRKNLSSEYKFFNPYSGKVEDLRMCKYVINRLFPSLSSSITSKVRSAVRRFFMNYGIVKELDPNYLSFRDNYNINRFYDEFSHLFYVANPDVSLRHIDKDINLALVEMLEDELTINDFFNRTNFDYDSILELDKKRKVVYGNLIYRASNMHLPTPKQRGEKFRKMANYLSQFEIL